MRMAKRFDSKQSQTPLASPKKVTLNLKNFLSPHAGSSSLTHSPSQIKLQSCNEHHQQYQQDEEEEQGMVNNFISSINSFDDCSFVGLKKRQNTENTAGSFSQIQGSSTELPKQFTSHRMRERELIKCGSRTALSCGKNQTTSSRNIQMEQLSPQAAEYQAISGVSQLMRSRKIRAVVPPAATPFQNNVLATLINQSTNKQSANKERINPAYRLDSKYLNQQQLNDQSSSAYFFSCQDVNFNHGGASSISLIQQSCHHRGTSVNVRKTGHSSSQATFASTQLIEDNCDDIIKLYEINWKNGDCSSLQTVSDFQEEQNHPESSFSPIKHPRATFSGGDRGRGHEYCDYRQTEFRPTSSSQKNILLKQFKIVKNQEHRLVKRYEKEKAMKMDPSTATTTTTVSVDSNDIFFCSLKDVTSLEGEEQASYNFKRSNDANTFSDNDQIQMFNSILNEEGEEGIQMKVIRSPIKVSGDTQKQFLVRKMQSQRSRINPNLDSKLPIKRSFRNIQPMKLIQSAQIL